MFDSPDDVLTYLRDNAVRYVDLRFCDLVGAMRHFTVPAGEVDARTFTDGLAFDGSSIVGFAEIHESDMLLVPDAATAVPDPFRREKTLNLTCSVRDPLTHEPYGRDPRGVALRAEEYLAESGFADTAYFGPEAEFYLFDSVRYDTGMHEGYYHVDSAAGAWNTGRPEEGRNLGYKAPRGGGYFLVPPHDQFADTRDEITTILTDLGIRVERAHHEVGTAGQTEINYRFDSLLRAADTLMLFKYVVRNVAWREGKTATFMPKPLHDDNGSGMHCHQSLWRDGQPLFHDEMGYAGLSDTARFYIGGLLTHAPSLLAFTNPTTNSYRRLVPGHEAPISLVYSQRNRSACCRIPVTGTDPAATRLEFRAPDPQANPYLAFPAMLMAGLDGIRTKTEPPAPIDKDLYELPPEEAKGIATVPTALEDALDNLAADHEYLLEGGVFTEDLISTWIERKRAEVDALRLRPHPYEFQMYYDL